MPDAPGEKHRQRTPCNEAAGAGFRGEWRPVMSEHFQAGGASRGFQGKGAVVRFGG